MTEELVRTVPSLSVAVETSASGAGEASERLGGFAAEHRVGAEVRDRLSAVAEQVVADLATTDGAVYRIVVEADIDQGSLQAIFSRPLGPQESVEATRARLDGIRASCDAFSAQCVDARLEVWVCFSL